MKGGARCAAFYLDKLCYRFIAPQKQKTREAFKSFREFFILLQQNLVEPAGIEPASRSSP
jgi:hypothetical protein